MLIRKKYLLLHSEASVLALLFYGVMVTRQILVLKFKVRVFVEQLKAEKAIYRIDK